MSDTHTTPCQSDTNSRTATGTALFLVATLFIIYTGVGHLAAGMFCVTLLTECVIMRFQGIRPE